MALNILTRSDTPVEIVLAHDPAMILNDLEKRQKYIVDGDCDGLDVPADATRFGIRALSQVELNEATEESTREHPGIELRAMRAYSHADDTEDLTEDDFVAMREFVHFRNKKDLALIKRGLVTIDGEPVPKDAYLIFAPESDEGIYPMSLRGEMMAELASHIKRVSELGPLGKSHYKPLFG